MTFPSRQTTGPSKDLSDVIFYMDFSEIFDRSSTLPRQQIRQEKARDMFRPEGVPGFWDPGMHRYLAFERSGSMSRQSKLSLSPGGCV